MERRHDHGELDGTECSFEGCVLEYEEEDCEEEWQREQVDNGRRRLVETGITGREKMRGVDEEISAT